ncbi:hypothetical protein [Bythopirellula polymerisocia]|nr:hypothetical protein [Bythopirellula polymerisocia]
MKLEPEFPQEIHSSTGDRLLSLDTYRGFTMLLLAFTVPNYGWESRIAEAHPDSTVVSVLMHQFEHVECQGTVLYRPLFMNLAVGLCLWLICFWMYRRKIFLRI